MTHYQLPGNVIKFSRWRFMLPMPLFGHFMHIYQNNVADWKAAYKHALNCRTISKSAEMEFNAIVSRVYIRTEDQVAFQRVVVAR